MKSIFLAMVFLFSAVSAQAVQFNCKSVDSGFSYDLDLEKGTLAEYDHTGQWLGTKENLKVSYPLFGETVPPTTVIEMGYETGGFEIQLTQRGESITGEIDDDYSLVCTKVVESKY